MPADFWRCTDGALHGPGIGRPFFFGLAVFLLVRADSENWPLGPRGFWESFQVAEVAQHRPFVLLSVLFAIFEWAVQMQRIEPRRAGLVFPLVCAVGGVLLRFQTFVLPCRPPHPAISCRHWKRSPCRRYPRSSRGIRGVTWHIIDLSDASCMRWLVNELRPSHLLHFAWYVPPGEFWTSLESVRCLKDSLDLLVAFLDSGGRRSVIAGTCAEYEWTGSEPLEECRTRIQPQTLYGASKAALQIHAQLASQAGTSFAWGRIFHLYGPFEHQSRFIPSVIRSLLAGQPAKCTHGRQIRDFMHVADVAHAFVELLFHSSEGAVNIASGRGVTIASVARKIGDIIGRSDLIQLNALPAPAVDPPYLVANIERLSGVGFTPTFTLEDGLRRTIAWWAERQGGAAYESR